MFSFIFVNKDEVYRRNWFSLYLMLIYCPIFCLRKVIVVVELWMALNFKLKVSQRFASNPWNYFVFFCVLKKWVHPIIGQCVRPSDRLHDNFRTETPIDLKFSAEFNLINISVKFEDGPDPWRILSMKHRYFSWFSY